MKHEADSPEGHPRGPNCWDCRFLAITWDMRLPYGCKLMGFRSRVIPSLEVLRTDGRFCVGFEPKPHLLEPADKPAQGSAGTPVKSPTPRRQTDRSRRSMGVNVII